MSKNKDHFNKLAPSERLGDQPIEHRYHQQMVEIARLIDEKLNGPNCPVNERKTGFVVMTFPFGESAGRCNYISNGINRDDVVRLMKEQIARFAMDKLQ
jgi:hypothetical protein